MLQSARACGGGEAPPSWCCRCPSRLISVAWRSYACAIGRTTSIRSSSGAGWEVATTTRAKDPVCRLAHGSSPIASRADDASTPSAYPRTTSGARTVAPAPFAPSNGAPRQVIVPESGLTNPQITLNSVVLPAPLGPITPRTSPRSTSTETPSRAVIPPNDTRTS